MQIEINCEHTRQTLARIYNTLVPRVGEGIHMHMVDNKPYSIHGLITEVNWDFTDIPRVRIYIKQTNT